MRELEHPERFSASLRVALVSVAANLSLTVVQIAVGLVGNSQALVADGFHTLSDLVADILVLFALVHGRRGADEEHPYGHARIETAVTLILGIILLGAGTGIAINAGLKISRWQAFVMPATITLWIALGTLAVKEAMYRYTMHVARRFDSSMLRASAWHHRSDALSSLVVLAGIGGALAGFPYLDAMAAVVVALLIVKIGGQLAWQALRELVDTGLSHAELESLRRAILDVTGVRALHMLRTRRVGGHVLADVHIIVDDKLSVSEGHQIGEAVRARLRQDTDTLEDVIVHIDTEDDAAEAMHPDLPLRDEVMRRLRGYFADIPQAHRIERIVLHYTGGRIVVELVLPLAAARDDVSAHQLASRFSAAVRQDRDIRSVSVLFR